MSGDWSGVNAEPLLKCRKRQHDGEITLLHNWNIINSMCIAEFKLEQVADMVPTW